MDAVQPLPVLRVQKQIHPTPGNPVSVQIEAFETQPVLLKVQTVTKTVSATGNLIAGNADDPDAYLLAGDTDLTTVNNGGVKTFLLTASVTLIVALSADADEDVDVWVFIDA